MNVGSDEAPTGLLDVNYPALITPVHVSPEMGDGPDRAPRREGEREISDDWMHRVLRGLYMWVAVGVLASLGLVYAALEDDASWFAALCLVCESVMGKGCFYSRVPGFQHSGCLISTSIVGTCFAFGSIVLGLISCAQDEEAEDAKYVLGWVSLGLACVVLVMLCGMIAYLRAAIQGPTLPMVYPTEDDVEKKEEKAHRRRLHAARRAREREAQEAEREARIARREKRRSMKMDKSASPDQTKAEEVPIAPFHQSQV
ncbi:hypothetical protein KIPB_001151 [Kipferlia bialata]|uniref:Transmembrane protein n=1 Tax=Kipferlia bialata TaxID=797122 RepID=A0A9K3CNJ6_9EUKA|nr:hypothetical protein KIPB_001151 [Kipferlia bialata]|eukprot:g1151.t1